MCIRGPGPEVLIGNDSQVFTNMKQYWYYLERYRLKQTKRHLTYIFQCCGLQASCRYHSHIHEKAQSAIFKCKLQASWSLPAIIMMIFACDLSDVSEHQCLHPAHTWASLGGQHHHSIDTLWTNGRLFPATMISRWLLNIATTVYLTDHCPKYNGIPAFLVQATCTQGSKKNLNLIQHNLNFRLTLSLTRTFWKLEWARDCGSEIILRDGIVQLEHEVVVSTPAPAAAAAGPPWATNKLKMQPASKSGNYHDVYNCWNNLIFFLLNLNFRNSFRTWPRAGSP